MSSLEDFMALTIFACSLPALVTLGCAFITVPITMIVIGAVYMSECPAQEMIPIYLIVAGSFFLISSCCSTSQADEKDPKTRKCHPLGFALNLFNCVWLIAGSYWVLTQYSPDYSDNTNPRYCHKTVYLFTVSIIIIQYILLALAIVATLVFSLCLRNRSPEEVVRM